MIPILLILAGLVALVFGAEYLVRGASRLASSLGVPSLLVGLTIVAFGTSAPELAVSVDASLSGQAAIAVGNVVGSNIFNVLLILGVCSAITPLVVDPKLLRIDVPFMIGISVLMWFMANDLVITQLEGGILVSLFVAYVARCIIAARNEKSAKPDTADSNTQEADQPQTSVAANAARNLGLSLFGLVLLVLGARWLVRGAVDLAQMAGISDLVVGLTVVAFGTSLPELATSVVAAFRGERDLAIANVVGSNIFNILCVLGTTSFVTSGGVPVSAQAIALDIPVMTIAAVLCVPVFFTGLRISRIEATAFVVLFAGYMGYLFKVASAAT